MEDRHKFYALPQVKLMIAAGIVIKISLFFGKTSNIFYGNGICMCDSISIAIPREMSIKLFICQ